MCFEEQHNLKHISELHTMLLLREGRLERPLAVTHHSANTPDAASVAHTYSSMSKTDFSVSSDETMVHIWKELLLRVRLTA